MRPRAGAGFAAAAIGLYNRGGEVDKRGGDTRGDANDNADRIGAVRQSGFQEDANGAAGAEGYVRGEFAGG